MEKAQRRGKMNTEKYDSMKKLLALRKAQRDMARSGLDGLEEVQE